MDTKRKDKDVEKLIKLLLSLPKPPNVNLGDEPEGKIRCSGCGKLIDATEISTIKSPYNYKKGNTIIDTTCKSCRNSVKDFAYIVCPHSQRVIARMEPHVDITGFEFKKNGIYHVDNSPQHMQEVDADFKIDNDKNKEKVVMKAIIIEKMLFDKHNKTKTIITK